MLLREHKDVLNVKSKDGGVSFLSTEEEQEQG